MIAKQANKQTDCPKTCHFCDCRELCVSLNVNPFNDDALKKVKSIVLHTKKGDALYSINKNLTAIYSIRAGSFKLMNAQEHIVDFCLQGDALGFDGIESSYHKLTAIALENSTICGFDYKSFVQAISKDAIVNLDFLQLMSKKINAAMCFTDAPQEAHVKLARFIYKIANHQKRCGYSNQSFTLPMKHLEIANHLSLSIETISRAFKLLAQDNILKANHKDISILDFARLKEMTS
jgi:CRP/FNR family transcriptional regulator